MPGDAMSAENTPTAELAPLAAHDPPVPRPTTRWRRHAVIVGAAAAVALPAAFGSTRPLRMPTGTTATLALTGALTVLVAVPVLALARRTERRARRVSALAERISAGLDQAPLPGPAPDAAASPGGPDPVSRRGHLLGACEAALDRRDVIGGQVALILLDVAHPEQILAELGATGPVDVARQTMRRLRAWLPAQDTVVQLGPSTFAVLTEGVGPSGAEGHTARLATLLAEPMSSGERMTTVAYAIGIALSDAELATGETLLRAAQEARLHAAADTGHTHGHRSAWRSYDRDHHAGAMVTGALEIELRDALRAQRIQAAFQPIVRLGEHPGQDTTIAMQALPRWTRPDGSDVPADRFLALAEAMGLAGVLGMQVIDCGLDAVSAWYAAGFPVGRLAVRLTAAQLADPDLPATVVGHLARRDLPATALVVGVDVATVSDGAQVRPALTLLRAEGAEVILTGIVAPVAATGLLRGLPLSGISVHPRVTEDMVDRPAAASAAVALCRRMGLRCLADGVTTPEHLAAARRIGIDAVSGPLVGRPARARDVSARFGALARTTYS
jgi:predicted signal transduction protein with EAL and GGDEF domain